MDGKRMEYQGRDVDEAINNACVDLGVGREVLDIEIVSTGSSGIFGLGRKKAVVRVSLRPGTDSVTGPAAAAGPAPAQEETAAGPAAAAVNESRRLDTRPPSSAGGQQGPRMPAADQEALRQDLLRMLELMGCPAQVKVLEEENGLLFQIDGPELATIIGQDGQTLDALQYLVRKFASRRFPHRLGISLDAGGFREKRRQQLEAQALALAEEVKSSGKTRTISSLNPAERRIVHLTLQADSGIRSRSVGEGLFKKVLIYPPGKGRKRSSRPSRRRRGDRQRR